jgi:hypothetical protein
MDIAARLDVTRRTLDRWGVRPIRKGRDRVTLPIVSKLVSAGVQLDPGLGQVIRESVRTLSHLSHGAEVVAAALANPECHPVKLETPRDYHEYSRAWELIQSGTRRQLGLDAPGAGGQSITQVAVLLDCRRESQLDDEPGEVIDLESVSSPPTVE